MIVAGKGLSSDIKVEEGKEYQNVFKVNLNVIERERYKQQKGAFKNIEIPYKARKKVINFLLFFFSIRVFFHQHSRIAGLQGKGESIFLIPQYHFHPLHRKLAISRTITAASSPVHIVSSRLRTRSPWFPSASR